MRKTGHSLISRPSTSPTSVIFGDTPPPASAREFGLWRPGKQRLPARIRHEVFLQREMAQLLEKIIDNAHFQDEGNNKEAKEETLKLPHRENWPTLEFPVAWPAQEPAQETKAQPVDVLLQQSSLYRPQNENAAPEQKLAVPTEGTAAQETPPSRANSRGSVNKTGEQNRMLSKRKVAGKKPAVPKSPSSPVKKSPSGWQHLRLAATAFRPFGGLGDAMKRREESKQTIEPEDEQEMEGPLEPEEVAQEDEEVKTTSKNSVFNMCLDLSKEYLVPLDEVKKCFDEFKQIDTSGDLLISLDEFEASARVNMSWAEDKEMPAELKTRIQKYFQEMDRDSNEVIDFPEYFDWSMKHRWTEEFLARDEKDLENRRLAREAEVSISEVERYRQMFDEFDTDGSEEISQPEFVFVIMQIMEVKDPRDIPTPTLNRYWQEVDTDSSGSVSFREFLFWMLTKGPEMSKPSLHSSFLRAVS